MADERRKRASTSLEMLKGKLASSTQIFKDPGKEKSRTETFGDGCEIPDQVPYPQMVVMKGKVGFKKTNKTKPKWVVVDTTSIVLYNSEKEAEEYLKRGLVVLCKVETNGQEKSITFSFFTEREITLIFESVQDMNEWALTLDGILANNFNRRVLDPNRKPKIIEELYLKNIKGGLAKCLCDDEEEWQYEGNCIVLHGHPESSFKWDGAKLQGSDENLVGIWDGSVIKIVQKHKSALHFIYIPVVREYLCVEKEEWSWKWTRHFLASKGSVGASWLMEGSVPEPIVMILQGFRHLKEL